MISWFEKHSGVSWGITIFGAIAIFYLSSLTFGPVTGGKSILSMVYHIMAFFCLTFFLLISIVRGKNREFLIPSVIIGILYGIFYELHQFFVPGRYAGGFDVFLDSLGAMFAFMIYLISIEYRNLRSGN